MKCKAQEYNKRVTEQGIESLSEYEKNTWVLELGLEMAMVLTSDEEKLLIFIETSHYNFLLLNSGSSKAQRKATAYISKDTEKWVEEKLGKKRYEVLLEKVASEL